jgi:simple sugar transport system permease protein/ribose transport system permease protein
VTEFDLVSGPGERAAEAGDVPARSVATPLAVVGAVVALAVIGWATTPEFVTFRNLQNIVRSSALIGIIAVTLTFITIAGSFFSLSVSQTAAMAAIGLAAFLSWGWPVWVAVLVVFLIAAAVGLVQGGAVALGGNPIVVTLAVGAVLFGSGAWLTENHTVRTGTDAAEWIGTSRPLGVPMQTWAFMLITVVAAVVLSRSRFGREVTLVGANRSAASAAGLRPGRIALYVFAVSSLGAALAGVFVATQFGQGTLDQFDGADIDAIAAILVGGAAIQGGEGSAVRTALGAVFIAALQNLMVLRGFSFGVRLFFVGLAILISVSVFTVIRNRRQLA